MLAMSPAASAVYLRFSRKTASDAVPPDAKLGATVRPSSLQHVEIGRVPVEGGGGVFVAVWAAPVGVRHKVAPCPGNHLVGALVVDEQFVLVGHAAIGRQARIGWSHGCYTGTNGPTVKDC